MNAHKTAISRKVPSRPMRALSDTERLRGRMLDFGCGKGTDAQHYGMESYDPHFAPELPTGQFDTITCNYVLNVVEDAQERLAILLQIQSLLKLSGKAYITVRADKKALNGITSKGTWQGYIDMPGLWRVFQTSGYDTYLLTREDTITEMVTHATT